MASYVLPTFNVLADIWTYPNAPPGAPDFVGVLCQLYLGSRYPIVFPTKNALDAQVPVEIRFPMGTSVNRRDTIAVPSASILYYTVLFVEREHYGFANEYVIALALQGVPPFPSAGSGSLDGEYTPVISDVFNTTFTGPPGNNACWFQAGRYLVVAGSVWAQSTFGGPYQFQVDLPTSFNYLSGDVVPGNTAVAGTDFGVVVGANGGFPASSAQYQPLGGGVFPVYVDPDVAFGGYPILWTWRISYKWAP
jgi:hypothetical protein